MSPVAHFLWLSRPHPATNTSARSMSRKSFIVRWFLGITLVACAASSCLHMTSLWLTIPWNPGGIWAGPGQGQARRDAEAWSGRGHSVSDGKIKRICNYWACRQSSYLVLLALDIFVVNDDLRWLEPGEEVQNNFKGDSWRDSFRTCIQRRPFIYPTTIYILQIILFNRLPLVPNHFIQLAYSGFEWGMG